MGTSTVNVTSSPASYVFSHTALHVSPGGETVAAGALLPGVYVSVNVRRKVAVTARGADSVTRHTSAVPLQSPPQPALRPVATKGGWGKLGQVLRSGWIRPRDLPQMRISTSSQLEKIINGSTPPPFFSPIVQ